MTVRTQLTQFGVGLICGLAALLALTSSGVSADDRLHGTWYLVPEGAEAKVQNARVIEIHPASGPMLNLYPDADGSMKVVQGPRFEVEGGVFILYDDAGEPSRFPYRFDGEDTVIYAEEYVYHRLRDQDSLLATVLRLVKTGKVESVKKRYDARRFGGNGAYSVYLKDAGVSILLMQFEGAEFSGSIHREDGDWAVPVAADTVAIATDDSRSLDSFHALLGEAFPHLRR
ncbi:hypothetical protein [Halomonas faecis]|uniref:hypothetical protein n=1 Tax=Halomonas faecis TaxID=1562110 RepID=UPI0013CFD95F|nr:hypothetical protein [Halomonas faecis]